MSRWILLSLVMAGCGAVELSAACGPETCGGCCSASGECVGATAMTCGRAGAQCVSCGAGASCAAGQCRVPVMTPVDAGLPRRDAGSIDAGLVVDAGVVDAGAGFDAGVFIDAGRHDAGVFDAGVPCPASRLMPENVAFNGDFECAGAAPFTSSGGGGRVDVITGRSGRALRFTVAAGLFNNEFSSTWRFRVSRAGVWCARAYVKGTAAAVSMRLYLGPPGTAAGEMFDQPGPLPSWSRLPPTIAAVNVMGQVGDEGFLVFSDTTRTAGATIEVDDVDVWRSDDGLCREAR